MTNADRTALIEESRQEMNFVLNEWDAANVLLLGTHLATDWRLLLQNFGTPAEFSESPRQQQMQALHWLLSAENRVATSLNLAKRDKRSREEILELLCQRLSLKFLSHYVIAIIEGDTRWEVELAPKLDRILEAGWAVSLSSLPLDVDQKYMPLSDPSVPYERFQRY